MKALWHALSSDRAKMFWSRHRAKVEFYKYSAIPQDSADATLANSVAAECAQFIQANMVVNVEKIRKYNEAMTKMPIEDAKRFREDYFTREREHDAWCRLKMQGILAKRPRPPYPYS